MAVDFEEILTESIIAKNCLTSVAGYSPFQAVHGRTLEILDLSAERLPPNRLRELAITSMVEATACERARRAENSNTRASAELDEYKPGDLVEIFRRGINKDEHCWHGPCQITDTTSLCNGVVSVKFQGRVLLCRLQDVRRALVFFSFLQAPRLNSPLTIMAILVEQVRGKALRLGWFQCNGQWKAFEGNKHHGELLEAALHVASFYMQLDGCLQLRLGTSVRNLEGISGSDDSVLLCWPAGHVELCDVLFMPGSNRISLERTYESDWGMRSMVQFLLEDADTVQHARNNLADLDHLSAIYSRQWHRGPVRQVRAITDSAPTGARVSATAPDPSSSSTRTAAAAPTAPDSTPGRGTASQATGSQQQEPARLDIAGSVDETVLANEASQDATSLAAFLTGRAVEDLCSRDSERRPAADAAVQYDDEAPADPPDLDGVPSLVFDEVTALFFGLSNAPGVVIERANNIIDRSEALLHPEACRKGNA